MRIYMLVDSTKLSLPIDMDLSLKRLADRWSIPYQTAKNAVNDGRTIRYIRAKLESIEVPKDELVYRSKK